MMKGWSHISLICISLLISAVAAPGQKTDHTEIDLPELLNAAADYCRKLEGAALDFVCLEKIVEIFDPKLDVKPPVEYPLENLVNMKNIDRLKALSIRYPSKKDTYVYDYQCIRKKGTLTEIRTLLRENGRKKNEPNAELKTSIVLYQHILLGPVGIFASRNQPFFDYAVVGQKKIKRRPVIIIEAIPKQNAPSSIVLYGKAWIEPVSGDILKIEWNPERVGHFERFENRGKEYGLEPKLTLTSEFEVAKNGLRFPTRFIAEEAYLAKSGRSFIRSTTTVTYTDFKFFTVEVEIH